MEERGPGDHRVVTPYAPRRGYQYNTSLIREVDRILTIKKRCGKKAVNDNKGIPRYSSARANSRSGICDINMGDEKRHNEPAGGCCCNKTTYKRISL